MANVSAPECPICRWFYGRQLRLYVRSVSRRYVPVGWLCRRCKTVTIAESLNVSQLRATP